MGRSEIIIDIIQAEILPVLQIGSETQKSRILAVVMIEPVVPLQLMSLKGHEICSAGTCTGTVIKMDSEFQKAVKNPCRIDSPHSSAFDDNSCFHFFRILFMIRSSFSG